MDLARLWRRGSVLLGLTLLVLSCVSSTSTPLQGAAGAAPDGAGGASEELAGVEAVPVYDRALWGRWADLDRDCQDTRQEVLIAESLEPVTFEDPAKPCRVATGKWICPYTGFVYRLPSDLEIDHVVSLKEAHDLGGWAWPADQKSRYYNDLDNPGHLVAGQVSANRSKGSRGPTEWLPPDPARRCAYLKARVEVLKKWSLLLSYELYLRLVMENCR